MTPATPWHSRHAFPAWLQVGEGLRGEPQFGAWPTLPRPRVAFRARDWNTRLGLVAAGQGITTVPEIAVPGLRTDIVTVPVENPAWSGRTVVAATRDPR
ncbi:LysR substrate-binding domain-containing protein [Promicromonospora sp. MS192]|uniref:LysR substrate-binding domain-containing protein n=1 Tax=Promicromonospora sp. MS192 TaxID=3412684 RepID=UPI003C2B94C4